MGDFFFIKSSFSYSVGYAQKYKDFSTSIAPVNFILKGKDGFENNGGERTATRYKSSQGEMGLLHELLFVFKKDHGNFQNN